MTGNLARSRRLCLLPKMSGVGGMVSFRAKLQSGLIARGFEVSNSLEDEPYDAILVIGGTRQLVGLNQMRRRGVPIIQRLDGMNWIHRKQNTGVRHYLRAELANWLIVTIRNRLASQVVYQSHFAREWWERVYGITPVRDTVILNGVDLDQYSPEGGEYPPDHLRLLVVEGHLGGGYEIGLQHALELARRVQLQLGDQVELTIAGKAEPGLKEMLTGQPGIQLDWRDWVPAERIPALDRSAHMLYASDLHPACPNAVIEALACGLPVLGYDTGALREIVNDGAGEIVPYGGDAWSLDPPDSESLAQAAIQIFHNQATYRRAARLRAENGLGLAAMIEGYLGVLGWN